MALMDIGKIGNEEIIFKRKFRWLLYYEGEQEGSNEVYTARIASRPTLTVEPTQIDRLHERHYIAGRPTWDTIGVTVYDVKSNANVDTYDGGTDTSKFLRWVQSAWKFGTGQGTPDGYDRFDMGDHDREYKKNLTLQLLSGHGKAMETWWLIGCWPTTVNWGDLDYSSNDTADLEVTFRFDRVNFANYDLAGANEDGAADV